jgi:hypothetical protein
LIAGLGGGGFLLLLICGGVALFFYSRAQSLNVFAPHLAEYTALPANDKTGQIDDLPTDRPGGKLYTHMTSVDAGPDGGYIRGKAVAVDIDGPTIDSLTNDLPGEIRASRPEEVQTVIWVKKISVSGYQQGNRAVSKTDILVAVIDRQAQKTVAVQHFESEGTTLPPWTKAMQYIRSLPHK